MDYVIYVAALFGLAAFCLYLGGHHDIEMHWAVTAALVGSVLVTGFVATQLGLPARSASIHDLSGLIGIIIEYGGLVGLVAVGLGAAVGYGYGNSQHQKGQ